MSKGINPHCIIMRLANIDIYFLSDQFRCHSLFTKFETILFVVVINLMSDIALVIHLEILQRKGEDVANRVELPHCKVLILHWFYILQRKRAKTIADRKISLSIIKLMLCYCQFDLQTKNRFPFIILFISMQNSNRISKCYTQGAYHNDTIITIKNFISRPNTQTLTKQSKFINPYSKQKSSKKTYRFQEPHSIILVPKKHKAVKSQIKMSPYAYEQQQQGQQKYKTDKIIKKGIISSLFIGFHQASGQKVAIKKIYQYSNIKNQQAHLLKKLQSQNIVRVIDHYYSIEQSRKVQCLVMEFYEADLYACMKEKRRGLTQHQVVNYAFQILKGIEHMHRNSIVHRDLKPNNILVNPQNNKLVIADFGSAKQICFGQTVSGQPCPFSYRAPQLAYGVNSYSFSSDMWFFACILYEMAYKDIPFKARSNTELTLQIMNMLGTPSLQEIYQLNYHFDAREYQTLPRIRGKYPSCMNSVVPLNDLLKKIFVYSPDRRLTASQALAHPYFNHIKFNQQLSQTVEYKGRTFNKNQYTQQKFNTPFAKEKNDGSNIKTVATLEDEQTANYSNRLRISTQKQGRTLKTGPRIFKKLPF